MRNGFDCRKGQVMKRNLRQDLQELLEKEYGISTSGQLEKAVREMSKIDISLFLTPLSKEKDAFFARDITKMELYQK